MATLFEMEPLQPLGESGLTLNDAQRRAITHGEGPLLVIAGRAVETVHGRSSGGEKVAAVNPLNES